MDRRAFLATAVAGTSVSLGGCLEDSPHASAADPPDEVVDEEFASISLEDAVAAVDEPPVITFREVDSQVAIEGSLTYSSSSCGGIELGETDYVADDGTLTTSVAGYYEQPSGTDCTADEVNTAYRLTLTFDDGLPSLVEVTEDGNMGTFEVTGSP